MSGDTDCLSLRDETLCFSFYLMQEAEPPSETQCFLIETREHKVICDKVRNVMCHPGFKYAQKHLECARNRPLNKCDNNAMIVHCLVNCLNSVAVFHSVLLHFVRTELCWNAAQTFTMEVNIISKTGKKRATTEQIELEDHAYNFLNCQSLVQSSSFLEVTCWIKNASCPFRESARSRNKWSEHCRLPMAPYTLYARVSLQQILPCSRNRKLVSKQLFE